MKTPKTTEIENKVLHEEFFAIRSETNVAAPERDTKET